MDSRHEQNQQDLPSEPPPSKGSWKPWVKLCLSLGLLSWLISQTGASALGEKLSHANWIYIPVGVAIYLVSQWISSYRWQFLSRPMGISMAVSKFFSLYLLGMFYSLFLPGSIGGDVVRLLTLARIGQVQKRRALMTLLAERGVGLVALLLLTGGVMLIPSMDIIPWPVRGVIWAMAAMALLSFVLLKGAGQWLIALPVLVRFRGFLTEVSGYWEDTWLLAKSVGLSLLVHGCMVAIHLLMAEAFGVPWGQVELSMWVAVYGVVTLMSVFPLFFNGIGVREGGYVFFLGLAGLSPETALGIALYWFAISSLTSVVGAWFFIRGVDAPSALPPPKVFGTAAPTP